MLTIKKPGSLLTMALVVMLILECSAAQIPGLGREYAELVRLRPAEVHLANQTIMIQVTPVDQRASTMIERLKKLITNGMIGVCKNLREVDKNPGIMVDCSLTNYDYNERTEEKKILGVKKKGVFTIITAMIEGSYKVVRVAGNATLYSGNVSIPYKDEFQKGAVETAPHKTEVENALIRGLVKAVLGKLTNTEEKIKVRLMGKGDLGRFARLAQAGQWAEYIESIRSLPEQKPDSKGESSFEGDRHYNLSIAHEARYYETMWKDYKRAEQYFDLADSDLRKARQFDPREGEYINAQARLGKAKQYFDTIKERFPQDVDPPEGKGGGRDITTTPQPQPPSPPDAMTNKDVIEMVNAGVGERLIIEQINDAPDKQFDTSTKGIIQLTKAGVSEKIIDAIKRANRRQPAPQQPGRKRP
jgi:hypothetical protein